MRVERWVDKLLSSFSKATDGSFCEISEIWPQASRFPKIQYSMK